MTKEPRIASTLCLRFVYAGAGLSGKTSNLKYIWTNTPSLQRDLHREEIAPGADLLTVGCDALKWPLLPDVQTHVALQAIPGNLFHVAERRDILDGADGIMMVLDSQRERYQANTSSLEGTRDALAHHGMDIASTPMVLQYNKRDLPNAMPVEQMRALYNPERYYPEYEASAAHFHGQGVFESLGELVSRRLLQWKTEALAATMTPQTVHESLAGLRHVLNDPAAPNICSIAALLSRWPGKNGS
ncbi:MAG: hypothetical protein AAFX99_17590, partial [Myxococcota bacterium]